MGVVDWLRGFRKQPSAYTEPPGTWKEFSGNNAMEYGTAAGTLVTPERSQSLAAYMACLRVISEDVGKLPLFVYERLEPRGKERAPDHWAYKLLHTSPNPLNSSQVFRETITHWAAGWGNGYAEIERDADMRPRALHPIHPSRCFPKYDKSGTLKYEVIEPDFSKSYLNTQDVIHIRGMGDEIAGYSMCKYGAQSIGVALAAQLFAGAYFGNGLNFSGVLEHPNKLTPEARKNLRDSFNERHAGPTRAHQMAILEEGMKYAKLGVPPEEAQFLESRQFQVEEICRWFRVAPHKIQHLLRSTYSNIEQQSIEHVTDTLMPWLVRWEQEIQRKLFVDEPDIFAEHLVHGLLRGDNAARSAYYTARFNVGSLSINDIRELENENPIGPDGDEYFLQQGMAPVSRIIRQPIDPGPKQVSPATDNEEDEPLNDEQAKALATSVLTEPIMRALRKDSIAIGRHSDKPGYAEWLHEFCVSQKEDLRKSLADSLWGIFQLMQPGAERTSETPAGTMIDAFYEWLERRYRDTKDGLANDATAADFVAKIFEGLQNNRKWGF